MEIHNRNISKLMYRLFVMMPNCYTILHTECTGMTWFQPEGILQKLNQNYKYIQGDSSSITKSKKNQAYSRDQTLIGTYRVANVNRSHYKIFKIIHNRNTRQKTLQDHFNNTRHICRWPTITTTEGAKGFFFRCMEALIASKLWYMAHRLHHLELLLLLQQFLSISLQVIEKGVPSPISLKFTQRINAGDHALVSP